MTESQQDKQRREELKELKSVKKLLILQLLKMGCSSEEIDLAVGMGAANIRRLFPNVKSRSIKKKGITKNAN